MLDLFLSFVQEYQNLQIFDLYMDNMSVNDLQIDTDTSGTSSIGRGRGRGGAIQRYLSSLIHSHSCQSIIDQLRSPFLSLPHQYLSSLPHHSSFPSQLCEMTSKSIGIHYRFLPGQEDFIQNDYTFLLPVSFDILKALSSFLPFSTNIANLGLPTVYPYSYTFDGIQSCFITNSNDVNQILVEIFTYFDGRYGQFIVLVNENVSCTIWYQFCVGSVDRAPQGIHLFNHLDLFNPFTNMAYIDPRFHKISLIETYELTKFIKYAFHNELPFSTINIPATGNLFKAIGLGLMAAVFLSIGICPK